jgi:hypothetical protein
MPALHMRHSLCQRGTVVVYMACVLFALQKPLGVSLDNTNSCSMVGLKRLTQLLLPAWRVVDPHNQVMWC